MNVFAIDKGIGRLDAYRKPIVVATVVAVIIGIFVGCGKDRVKVSGAEIEALSKQIKDLVTGLEYSDKVAEDFVNMVISWEDRRGRPILVVWKKKVAKAKESCKQGKISKGELAKVEESIVRELGQMTRKEFSYKGKCFDLADVIEHKQANCLGYSQLLYILGNSTELSVKTIGVTQKMDATPSVHVACIVGLTDGKTMMVDLAFRFTVSKPFKLEEEFIKVGNYWELKDKNNPLGIHRRIQISDRNGLIAGVYYNQGNDYYELGQHTQAISDYTKAIELDPNYAMAYTNRGNAYRRLGQYTKAVLDYTKAIELDPKDADAYHNRGIAYIKLGQPTQAISDLNRALQLDPEDAETYYMRGLTYALLEKYKEAKKDLLTSVKLDPALKADVKKIYMKLFEFPLVDFKLDTSAGSRNK